MTLLQPAALLLAAALAPIIVLLYLLRLRRRPATVSTLLFWQRVLAEQRRRALLGRLRRVLSLLLQLLLLSLLVLALARPEITGLFAASAGADSNGNETATVLVLDCRARMQAREADGRTRFERARELLAAHARRAGPRRPAALLVAGHAPRVLAPLTDDDRALLAALDTASPEDAGGSLDAALELAAELLAAHSGQTQILVFTDLPLPPPETSKFKSPIHVLPVADPRAPRENVALTRLSIRPRLDSPQTHEVFLQLENFGAQRQTGEVELSLDGRLFDVRPFDLAPGERRTEIYPALAPDRALANARGWLVAHLARPKNADPATADALALDDDAFAVLPPARPVRVLLVTRGNWFLENLLRADDGVDFQQLAPDAFQPAIAGGFDAVLLDDTLPDAFARLDALPPAGNFLFIRRTPLGGGNENPETLDRPLVADLDAASPLLRLVDWRQVTLGRAAALPPVDALNAESTGGGWRLSAPVRAAGDRPLIVTGERRTGSGGRPQRLAALAFGLTEGDLPLRVAFPLFMANTVRWLAGGGEENATPTGLRAGETLRLAVGETLWTRPLRAPRPAPPALPSTERLDGPGVFQPLQNGFYLLRRPASPEAPAGEERWLAVNTDDPAASALNAAPPANPADPAPAAPPPAADTRWWAALRARPPWVPLALAAFALCALEWGLFHRRRTE